MQEIINFNSFILLLTFAVNIGLSAFIYSRDQKNEVNRSFSALLFCVAIWTLSFFFFQNVKNTAWILLARRFTPVGSSLIASYFLYFSLIFPAKEQKPSFFAKTFLILPGFIFSTLSVFSGLLVLSVAVTDPKFPFLGKIVFGPLYKLFALYFVLYFSAGIIILLIKYLKAQGKAKLQIFYVLFGIGISGVLGMITSLALPLLGFSHLFTSGPPFTLIMAGFLTYAIVKHRLLGIDDFLSRGVLVLSFFILAVGTIALVANGRIAYLLPFYTALANLGLGAFVYFRGRKNRLNRIFGLLALVLAAWGGLIFLSNTTLDYNHALLYSRLIYAVAAFIPLIALYFILHFPFSMAGFSYYQFIIPLLLGLSASGTALFSNLIVKNVFFVADGSKVIPGSYYPLFLAYVLLLLVYGIYHLIRKNQAAQGIQRVQIRYFFFGGAVSLLFAAFANFFLPLAGNAQFSNTLPTSMLIMVGFVSYCVMKHRLMSIEILIQQSTVYTFAIAGITVIYIVAVAVSESYFQRVFGYTSFMVTVFSAVLIAAFYQPLVRLLQKVTDHLFLRGRYDYQQTLREISEEIASVIKLEELARFVAASFIDKMKVSEISFLLLDKDGEHFRAVSLNIARYKRIEIDASSPVVSWLSVSRDILVRDEVEDILLSLGAEDAGYKKQLEEVRDEMERLGITVWVPIVSKDWLIGIIALGGKLSGDIFTSEDLALLTTLANQTAVALDNSRLYEEVLSVKNYNEEILQSMTNGVLTTDNLGRVVTLNHMGESLTGKKLGDIVGKSCEAIWGKRGTITQAVESALQGNICANIESGIGSDKRGLIPVSFSSTLLRDSQGKKMGVLLSIQDISEIKELEGKVRRADKLSALATMAAGMAHEIKNPLSSMKVFSQLLPTKYDDPEYREKLQGILPREINRIDRIVESLLSFARATTPTFEESKIEAILDENIKYFEDQAKKAGVAVIKEYAALPAVEVDQSQIGQVFSNLIVNAIQAMPEGGELKIKTFPGKKVDDLLRDIKIQFTDTGHGISPEVQKKLFDPFFTTKYGGTGLGLTITHSIVDGHKGYIDVDSTIGRGTTFTVTLPVKQGLL